MTQMDGREKSAASAKSADNFRGELVMEACGLELWTLDLESCPETGLDSCRIRAIVPGHMFENIKVQLTELAGKLTHLRRFL
jgi:hypothetical protein